MGFVRRKATTTKSKSSKDEFEKLKHSFLANVVATVTMESIPESLVLNWDQTGINIVPSSAWTMDQQGAKRVEVIGVGQITAVFCCSLSGEFLPLQVIYTGKTTRCHPKFCFPSEWNVTHSPKHWSTEETMLEYVEKIILPYVDHVRQELNNEDQAALVIINNFRGQIIPAILEENNIHTCLLPANTIDQLQPLDVAVNKPAKAFLKKFELWFSEKVKEQLDGQDVDKAEFEPADLSLPEMKELGAKWLVEMAEYIKDNQQFIRNGFRHAGILDALELNNEDNSSRENGFTDFSDDDTDVITIGTDENNEQ